jgi:sulfite oxidase
VKNDFTIGSNRRELLTSLLALATISRAQDQHPEVVTIPGKRSMIVHNDRPEDLETPVRYFDQWLTPNDVFFVRQHLPRPTIEEGDFRLSINGRVSREIQLSVADLRKLPQYTVPAVLECTGNGRGFFRPRVAGAQWGRGAIGNAEWSGPRLLDVLKLAGAETQAAAFVTANGADVGIAKTPDFIRSLPMRKAVDPNTLLSLNMNGEPLSPLHGFPLRLVVPGWNGASWVKWVTSLSVTNERDQGFYMNPAYRFPKHPVPPGTAANPADLEVIEAMPVKSYITGHADGDKIPLSTTTLRGIAWAGEERITKVEVSTDSGVSWSEAQLSAKALPFTWRLWTIDWKPAAPGYYTILSRATDSARRVQPIIPVWNPSGYLFNAVDRIGVIVEAG